ELMFRLLKAGAEVVPDPVPGARLRVSRNSISSTNLAENAKRFLQLRAQIMEYLEAHGMQTKNRTDWNGRICQTALEDLNRAMKDGQ
ncbi:MAG: hypothetical protein AAF441_22630, partial [Pseudomonadota bacterium]